MSVALRILAAIGVAAASPAVAVPALLPMPQLVREGQGSFALSGASIRPGSAAGARFSDLLARGGGPRLPERADGTIRFVSDPAVQGAEAYRLDVTPAGVTVAASGAAGLFYGAETLWQLAARAQDGRIPAVHIEDRPAFAWRGLMLDSVRHFQPVDYVLQLLDRMAEAKLNTFHWHLTDDQGWRLQIDRYPRLTDVGAWRAEAGSGERVGGFYTKADVRRVVAYAAARHITVVPEIEMPGHATALIAAYPELGSTARPPKAPTSDWGILPNLLNTEDATFRFVETVLDEVMALFPSTYIHTGGDEAPKGQWKADPRAQARIRALGLRDENALQGWFTARIAAYLAQHGRRLIGWDEILEGDVPQAATVMSWRGTDGAIQAARAGHDTVLAPAPILYLDNRQSDAADETPGRGELIDWQRIYGFDPRPAALTPAEQAHVIGLQATLFTEHAPTLGWVDRMIWPRAAEVAEIAWSAPRQRDWAALAPRLVAAQARWQRLGWAFDTVPLTVTALATPSTITLAQPAHIGTIRYTLDGSAPTAASPAYAVPLPYRDGLQVAAQAFLGAQPLGSLRRWTFGAASLHTRTAAEMPLCGNKLPLRLVDARTHAIHWVDVLQPCWRWPAAPVAGTIRVTAEVARVPYNFAFGNDPAPVDFARPATPGGELVIRQDGCDGAPIATLPVTAGATRISGTIAPHGAGAHDLCMTFTQAAPDPLLVLDRLTLEPAR